MSAPWVLRAWQAVRNVAEARAWSPAPSPFGRALSCAKPLNTVTWSRTGANGWRVRGNSKDEPVCSGVQSFIIAPFGMYTKAIRNGGLPAAADAPAAAPKARTAGAEARNGSATAVPKPRRNVRLG